MYYVHKDHLGSLDKVTNSSGTVIQRTSFDACSVKRDFCEERAKTDVELIPAEERSREGRRRNPLDWTYTGIPSTTFSRGYTGHEHLDQFDLINMNGRMYDPILGRFLSVDKYVQNPYFSQSYNRYSYCFNNPLLYTDPGGWQLASIGEYWDLGAQNFEMRIGTHYPLITEGQNNESSWWDEFQKLKRHGYDGDYASFMKAIDSPTFNGTISFRPKGSWVTVENGEFTVRAYRKRTYKVTTVGGGGQSFILGPRDVDWGNSLENIGKHIEELDSKLHGNTYENNDPSNHAASVILGGVSKTLPPISIIMDVYSIIENKDPITGEILNQNDITESLISILLGIIPGIKFEYELLWDILKLSDIPTDKPSITPEN